MRARLSFTSSLAAALLALGVTASGTYGVGYDYDANTNWFVTGRAIVQVNNGVFGYDQSKAMAQIAAAGGNTNTIKWFSTSSSKYAAGLRGLATVELTDPNASVTNFCAQVKGTGVRFPGVTLQVLDATPDYLYTSFAVPNDGFYYLQWGVRPQQKGGTNIIFNGLIGNFPNAWDKATGRGVTIAVLDTGVDLTHEDLRPNLVSPLPSGLAVVPPNPFFLPQPAGGDPEDPPRTFDPGKPWDDNGHGTHVAGTAAARWRNRVGIAGAAPEAKILPIKVLDSTGVGTSADVATGITIAAMNGARVINMSLGGGLSPLIAAAVEFAQLSGSTVVAAMGNSGGQTQYAPAVYPGVVAVGSHDVSGARSIFSTTGPWITVSAPGGSGTTFNNQNPNDIFSTFPTYAVELNFETGAFLPEDVTSKYSYLFGTSMASPHVAGAAALLLQKHPKFSAAQVWANFARFADRVAPSVVFTNTLPGQKSGSNPSLTIVPPFNNTHGYGILDAYRLLAQIESPAIMFDANGNQVTFKGIPTRWVRMFAWTPRNGGVDPTPRAGQPYTFRVISVDDTGELLRSPKVTAHLSFTNGVGVGLSDFELYDNGNLGDQKASDGIFSRTMTIPLQTLNSNVVVQYTGTAANQFTATNVVVTFIPR